MTTEPFWHLHFPASETGGGKTMGLPADSESDARLQAADISLRIGGHVTITDRDGYVATYFNGAEWTP